MLKKLVFIVVLAVIGAATYDYFSKRLLTKQCKSNFDLPENAYWETDCWWACKPGWNKDVLNSVCTLDHQYVPKEKAMGIEEKAVNIETKVTTQYLDYKDLLTETNNCHVITDRVDEAGTVSIGCIDRNLQTTTMVCDLVDVDSKIESGFVNCEPDSEIDNVVCEYRMPKYAEERVVFRAKSCKFDN